MTAHTEVENFFSDIEKITFQAPGSAIRDTSGPPLICLFLENDKLNRYWKLGINENIRSVLDHKRPIFRFKTIEATRSITVSIVENETGMVIEILNAKLDDSMRGFVNFTATSDKIFLMVVSEQSDVLQPTRNNLLTILDGYEVVHL